MPGPSSTSSTTSTASSSSRASGPRTAWRRARSSSSSRRTTRITCAPRPAPRLPRGGARVAADPVRMRRYPDLESAARAAGAETAPRVATVGYFDGLHVGHQALLGELREWARGLGGESLVVTFDRHPQEVLTGSRPLRLLSAEHKLLLLERLGISAAITLSFTRELSLWSAAEFV